MESEASFDLTFKNPCCDPAFVEIKKPILPEINYILSSGSTEWTHDPFIVEYNPKPHSLCGTLDVVAFFAG